MESLTLKSVAEYGVFALLFFFLLLYILQAQKEDKKNAQIREDKLMEHIKKSDESLMIIADNVKEVSKNMATLQQNVNVMQQSMVFMQKDIDELKNQGINK